MNRAGGPCLVSALLLCLAMTATADQVYISDVPSYIWYRGCGPTAAGMIIGYWDGNGYADLIPGSNDWNTNQQAIKDMIASSGHVRDYVPTPDRAATPEDPYHEDDSVADFNQCSRDPYGYGWSLFSRQDDGLAGYAAYRGYDLVGAYNTVYFTDTFWNTFVDEIAAGRPVEFLVDTNGDGSTDHFVTAVGYDDASGARQYAAYNTWDHVLHWYDFRMIGLGRTFGVYGGTFFDPGPVPGDANGDGVVDGGDIAAWQENYDPLGVNVNTFSMGDWNGDGIIDGADLSIWQLGYDPMGGAGWGLVTAPVPEPGTISLGVLAVLGFFAAIRMRRKM